MESQTVTIQVAPMVAQLLQTLEERAKEQGLSLDFFLLRLVSLNGLEERDQARPFYETASREEWLQAFTKWADSHDPRIPPLPLEAVSRESIYEG